MKCGALALVPLAGDAKAGDQLFGVFLMAFRTLTLILVGRRGNLFEFELTLFAIEFVKCHTPSFYPNSWPVRQAAKIRL
jgi:hypothetical protein